MIFPFGVKVQAANLSFKVHYVVSGKRKLFAFKPEVISQSIFTCNSPIIINYNSIILRLHELNSTLERRKHPFSFKKNINLSLLVVQHR